METPPHSPWEDMLPAFVSQ